MKTTIKVASSTEDVETVRNLFIEYQKFLGFDLCFQNFDDELAKLPGKYAPPFGRLYIARSGDEVAGCMGMQRLDAKIAEIKRLYIRDEFRGAGLGRRFVETAIKDARGMGYALMRLDSVARLETARKLYESLGFKDCEPYNHNPEPDVYYMELML